MDDSAQAGRRKSKRDRFLMVAERRTIKALRAIQILTRCANRGNYEYGERDVSKIFDALHKELEKAKVAFSGGRPVRFSLAGEEDDEGANRSGSQEVRNK